MGDHWKSLANKLGAPGVDAPAAAEPPPEAHARPAAPPSTGSEKRSAERPSSAEPAPARRTERSRPDRSRADRSSPDRSTSERISSELSIPEHSSEPSSSDRFQPAAPVDEVIAPAPVRAVQPQPPETDKPAKRKSSWDTLTSFFGIASAPEPEEKANVHELSSAAPAETDALGGSPGTGFVEPRRPDPRTESRRDSRSESRREGRPDARPDSRSGRSSTSRTTSRSNEGRSTEARSNENRGSEVRGGEGRGSEVRGGEDRPGSRGFEPRTPETKQPTALDTLFGDAPRQELSWDKPTPRRVVDDVSGWDDDVPATEPESRAAGSDAGAPGARSLEGDVLEGDADAPQRRRRRRRRGTSRRDRGDETGGPIAEGDRADIGDDLPRGERAAPIDDLSDDEGDVWAEVEPLEPVASAESWSEPDSFNFESESTATDDETQPARRSSRRRRRGGRGRDRVEGAVEEGAEVRAPREPRESREGREPREPRPMREPIARDSSARESVAREPGELREPRAPRETADDASSPASRPRREQRTRSPRPAVDAPRRELAVVGADDPDDQVDSSLAAELEGEGGPNRHPKIPTWADSLEAIIASNMENRRRGDSQRGGPSRGRPRGGGGGTGSGSGPRR